MSPRRKAKPVPVEENIYSQLRDINFSTKTENSEGIDENLKSLENAVSFHFEDDEEAEFERDSSKWPVKAVELMTFHRLRLNSAFHSPKYAKNKLWDTISEYLKEANYNFDGKECHLKFRNMLATYKKNVEKVTVYGEECIKWKWFNAFHAVLQFKPSVQNTSDKQQNSSTDEARDGQPSHADEDETRMDNEPLKPTVANDGNLSNLSDPPETPESEFRKWGRAAVNLLLVLRHQFADIFNDPSSHKVQCWRKIAKILRESGYDVSDRDCIVKWHNLINTYRSNLRKSQNEHIRWEWFDLMSKILNHSSEADSPTPQSPPVTTLHVFPNTSLADSNVSNSAFSRREQTDQNQKTNHKSEQHSNIPTIPSDAEDDNLSIMTDNSEIFIDDTMSLEDILNDDKPPSDRYERKVKKYQRSYWKEKLKLLRAAEHRRKREWAERKHIELQKINLKKQKLKINHRLTKALEKLASSAFIRDALTNDRRNK